MKKINIAAMMVVLAALLVGCAQATDPVPPPPPPPPPPAITYTVTFDVNGGDHIDDLVAEEYTEVELLDATRTGYTFLGWDTDADGTSDDASFVLTDNVTAKALWSGPLSYTLTLVVGGFDWSMTAPTTYTVPYGTVITLPIVTNKYDHVEHDGWSTVAEDFDGTADYPTTYTMGASDITLYNAYH